ncbi:MAG: radical SAM protein [Anaerostipes sp.]|nr:radical SAM protein [Anaerostipes sp.]
MKEFSLEEYLSNGVEGVVKGMINASIKYPKASVFMIQHGIDSKKARVIRHQLEEEGCHIPPFLIVSITNQCNLHCKGCYARANYSCVDGASNDGLMSASNWDNVFSQAEELGIEFVLLIGGEPFVRKDILEVAAKHRKIVFPIFTNGTMIDKDYVGLLNKNRNLMPIFSIEGKQRTTDERRGRGVYEILQKSMKELRNKGIMFGASITVTNENIDEVLSDEFVSDLKESGTKIVVYVEYVPTDEQSKSLALIEKERAKLEKQLNEIRRKREGMVFFSFPGDEKSSGGCLAAGRGFFHINAHGGAEPCPFSPYSDTSILNITLKEALHSPLFYKLQTQGNLMKEHMGGCVLYEQKERVEALLKESL